MPDPTIVPEPTPSAETLNTENMVPQSRFSEVAKEKTSLAKQLSAKEQELADTLQRLKAFEDAQLSELEKANQKTAAAEARALKVTQQANERLTRAAFIAAAAKAGASNPGDAYALAIADGVVPELDDAGNLPGVDELVSGFVSAGRLPVAGPGRPKAPGLDGGAGSPDRSPGVPVRLTDLQRQMAKLAGMTEEDYAKYMVSGPTPDTGKSIAELLKQAEQGA